MVLCILVVMLVLAYISMRLRLALNGANGEWTGKDDVVDRPEAKTSEVPDAAATPQRPPTPPIPIPPPNDEAKSGSGREARAARHQELMRAQREAKENRRALHEQLMASQASSLDGLEAELRRIRAAEEEAIRRARAAHELQLQQIRLRFERAVSLLSEQFPPVATAGGGAATRPRDTELASSHGEVTEGDDLCLSTDRRRWFARHDPEGGHWQTTWLGDKPKLWWQFWRRKPRPLSLAVDNAVTDAFGYVGSCMVTQCISHLCFGSWFSVVFTAPFTEEGFARWNRTPAPTLKAFLGVCEATGHGRWIMVPFHWYLGKLNVAKAMLYHGLWNQMVTRLAQPSQKQLPTNIHSLLPPMAITNSGSSGEKHEAARVERTREARSFRGRGGRGGARTARPPPGGYRPSPAGTPRPQPVAVPIGARPEPSGRRGKRKRKRRASSPPAGGGQPPAPTPPPPGPGPGAPPPPRLPTDEELELRRLELLLPEAPNTPLPTFDDESEDPPNLPDFPEPPSHKPELMWVYLQKWSYSDLFTGRVQLLSPFSSESAFWRAAGYSARRRVYVVVQHYLDLIGLCAGQKVSDNTVRSIAFNAWSKGMFVGSAEHPDAQEDLIQVVFQRLLLREARMGNVGAGNPDIGVDSLNARGPNLTTEEYSGTTLSKCLKHLLTYPFATSSERSTELLAEPLRQVTSALSRTNAWLTQRPDLTGRSLALPSDIAEQFTPLIEKTSELLYTAYSTISAGSGSSTPDSRLARHEGRFLTGLELWLQGFTRWLGR